MFRSHFHCFAHEGFCGLISEDTENNQNVWVGCKSDDKADWKKVCITVRLQQNEQKLDFKRIQVKNVLTRTATSAPFMSDSAALNSRHVTATVHDELLCWKI